MVYKYKEDASSGVSLTLTWDVFKLSTIQFTTFWTTRLTLTWDVFKFFRGFIESIKIYSLTLTWDVFKFAPLVSATCKDRV